MMNRAAQFSEFTKLLHESKRPIIKKFVPKRAPIRNKVLGYLYENGPTKQSVFYQYLFGITESSGKPIATKSWLSKNKIFFKKFKKNGETYFDLNSYGRKIMEKLSMIKEGADPDEYDDHMEIELSPEEEVELRMGDMEIAISQKDGEDSEMDSDDFSDLRSKNAIDIDDLRGDSEPNDDFENPFSSGFDAKAGAMGKDGKGSVVTSYGKNVIDYDSFDDKSKF